MAGTAESAVDWSGQKPENEQNGPALGPFCITGRQNWSDHGRTRTGRTGSAGPAW